MTAGSAIALPDLEITTVSADVVFDVLEAAGQPQIDVASPYLYGYAYRPDGRSYAYASSYATAARPSVRIVGPPGTYTMYAYGNVSGQSRYFGSFTLKLEEPTQTTTGENVTVSLPPLTITFDYVTKGGVTSATVLPVGPQPPTGWDVYSANGARQYYDVQTSATTTGSIRVCVDYDDRAFADARESRLRLTQSDSTGLVDLTNITIDTAANRICGTTTKLGTFAILVSADQDNDGVPSDGDNCPDVANPAQENADSDQVGDACDVDDDNDGYNDSADNCRVMFNPDQQNLDGDLFGDTCDSDDDDDGAQDLSDNCPKLANADQKDLTNADQANLDGDAFGDVCDQDLDNDDLANVADNCASVFNADQSDLDSDGEGDACDADDDNDGALDSSDNCALIANPDQENSDGDADGDARV